MLSTKAYIIVRTAAFAASVALAASAGAYTNTTLSFQQGVGGYAGETDVQFTSSYDNNVNAGNGLAATGTQLFVDGYNGADSPDQQVFLKFDSLFGAGAGQIPSNAFIISASLTLTTGTSGSAQSGGPYGVGAVLVPWNKTTSTYNNLKTAGSPENGLSANYGVITRAVGFYDDPVVLFGGTNALESAATSATKGTNIYRYSTNVAPLVQGWLSGSLPNYGFTVHAGAHAATTDGWQIKTATNGTVGDRPKLSITYTTAPVQTASFQQGVNGYNGTIMSWVRLSNDSATNGAGIDNAYLDGFQDSFEEDSISSDDHALIKFNNLFQGQGGAIPAHAQIVKATLVLTTSTAGSAQTGQPYQAHQMLRDWDTHTTWSDFNADYGVRIGIDETEMLSAQYGMIPQSQAQFDVTQAVAAWAAGQPNYGIDVRATPPSPLDPYWTANNGTSDGWSIYFTGASDPTLRPQLLISYFLHMPGDANDNGKIDYDDFALIDRGFARQLNTWADGDFDYDGQVTAADYLIIDAAWAGQGGQPLSPSFLAAREAQFGAEYVSQLLAAVPEPGSLGLLGVASVLGLVRRRRR